MKRPLNEEGSNQTNSLNSDSIVPNISEYRDAVDMWVGLAVHKFHAAGNVAILNDCTAESVHEILALLHQSNLELLDRLVESLPEESGIFLKDLGKGKVVNTEGYANGWNDILGMVKAIIERQKQQLKRIGGDE